MFLLIKNKNWFFLVRIKASIWESFQIVLCVGLGEYKFMCYLQRCNALPRAVMSQCHMTWDHFQVLPRGWGARTHDPPLLVLWRLPFGEQESYVQLHKQVLQFLVRCELNSEQDTSNSFSYSI